MSVFSFKIERALFSVQGVIYLKLGISTSSNRSLLDHIVYLVGDSGEEVEGHTFTSKEVDVSSASQEKYHKFPDGDVTFYLPKGKIRRVGFIYILHGIRFLIQVLLL